MTRLPEREGRRKIIKLTNTMNLIYNVEIKRIIRILRFEVIKINYLYVFLFCYSKTYRERARQTQRQVDSERERERERAREREIVQFRASVHRGKK